MAAPPLSARGALALSTPPRDHPRLSASAIEQEAIARTILSNASLSLATRKDAPNTVTDFRSDVGSRNFGFGYEEMDAGTAYYEGQFKLHQRCGDGILHTPESGAKYEGQFWADKFHGKGSQTWQDGSQYTGDWKQGVKHGVGEYMSAEGLRFKGQWEDGKRHGQGTQEYANGDRYTGWWYHGMCSGLGTYHFADGSRYEGAWANGRYDGTGVLYGSDGTCERHRYSNGLLMKREVLPPASARGTPRSVVLKKAELAQAREDMHKSTLQTKLQPSKYLIVRETASMDLSAPPLRKPASFADAAPTFFTTGDCQSDLDAIAAVEQPGAAKLL